jgi:uncharacterized protein YuzE
VRPLTYRYDPVAQAVYIYIGDVQWRVAKRTIELGSDGNAMADLDQNDRLIGVEILSVAEPKIAVMGGRHKPVARPAQDTMGKGENE